MNAVLVLVMLIVGPAGPMAITIKLPWVSVEACKLYLEDPTPIQSDFGVIRPIGMQAACEKAEKKLERGA